MKNSKSEQKNDPPASDSPPDTKSELKLAFESPKFWLAVVLVGLYIVLVVYLFLIAKKTLETNWLRYLYLLAGVEAIVFAAVGYIFGKDVSRRSKELTDKAVSDAQKEKEKAEQKRKEEEQKKEAEKKKNQSLAKKLITLREAVIAENSLANQNPLSQLENFQKLSTDQSNIDIQNLRQTGSSRALNLALSYEDFDMEGLTVQFSYNIKVEGLRYLEINGQRKTKDSGYFFGISAATNTICVEVFRNNSKAWEFTATSIMDSEGEDMEMVSSPLTSTSNRGCFEIRHKD